MLNTRRSILVLGFMMAASVAGPSFAAAGNAPQEFTQEAFDSAQKAGKPVLIDTYATWCDICARQKPIIEKLTEEPKFKDLVTLRVNFATQKDVMRKFNTRIQSTLIVFRGTKEVGRSIGETQPEWIEDLIDKAMEKAPAS